MIFLNNSLADPLFDFDRNYKLDISYFAGLVTGVLHISIQIVYQFLNVPCHNNKIK